MAGGTGYWVLGLGTRYQDKLLGTGYYRQSQVVVNICLKVAGASTLFGPVPTDGGHHAKVLNEKDMMEWLVLEQPDPPLLVFRWPPRGAALVLPRRWPHRSKDFVSSKN